nr:hypothetical protein [Tanacetum cinerariifolium]
MKVTTVRVLSVVGLKPSAAKYILNAVKEDLMLLVLGVTTVSIHNIFAVRLKMKVTTVRVLSVVGLKP